MRDGEDRLESWKEVAAYLGKEVRTVQLWEKNEGLPIHRHQHSKQGSVYAFRSELNDWRVTRANSPAAVGPVTAELPNQPFPEAAAPAASSSRKIPIAWVGAALCFLALAGVALFLRARAAQRRVVPTSIAVLPFLDLSPRRDSEYFSDGLSEELIDALSRVSNLHVVARTSSFAFKGKNADIRQIGSALGVNAVIEGSVRKNGDDLRITAQLNRVADGYHLWSHTWDRKMRDVLTLQREISAAIAAELRADRPPGPSRPLTEDAEAYQLYSEGRYYFNKFEFPESNYKAIELYKQAIARDPKFAAAWAGIADAYSYLAEDLVVAPREVDPKAREAALKALALDDSSAAAHTSLGIVKLDYDRDVEGAQREFLRAMQLNPGFAWARHWYAHSLEGQNKMEEALHEMRAALDLDPYSVPINWDVGGELINLGRYDEALQHLKKAQELFPSVPNFRYMIAMDHWRKGDNAAADKAIDELIALPGETNDPTIIAITAAREARKGRVAEARKLIARVEEIRKTRYVDAFSMLETAKALNDQEQLLMWLHRADEERSTFFVFLRPYARFWGLDESDLAAFAASKRS